MKACYKKNQLKLLAKRLYEAAKALSESCENIVASEQRYSYGAKDELDKVLAEYEEATK